MFSATRMKDAGPHDAMSMQELRSRMFESLRTAGVADKLKSQLRAKIVAELKLRVHAHALGKGPNRGSGLDDTGSTKGRLLHQVLDSMLVDYLKARGFDFTLSVFLPESGLNQKNQILSQEDIMQALHMDNHTVFFRELNALMKFQDSVLLVNLLTSLIRIADLPVADKDVQTDLDIEDFLDSKFRETDRNVAQRKQDQARLHALAVEERILRYQQEVESRLRIEMEQQLTQFRSIELAQMRVEEKKKYQSDMSRLKTDFEQKTVELQEKATTLLEQERVRLAEREKDLEKHNMDLRQKLLEENNRAVMKEATLRTEAELMAKEVKLERDAVQRRYDEALAQLSQLQNLKEKYSEKLQESMAQYKIDTNREYSNLVSSVEIEKAKLEAERAMLREKTSAVEKMSAQVQRAQQDMDDIQDQLKEARAQALRWRQEKEEAEHTVKDLSLQLMSHKTSSALEFEIQSLKQQLVEAERMAERRQEDYQSLLKTLMLPNDDVQKELAKCRRSEAKWQRECQNLVMRLDSELNRNEELQRKCEDSVLQVKELKRENADLRLVLHQTREALNHQIAQDSVIDFRSNNQPRSDFLPDPLDPGLDALYHKYRQERLPKARLPEVDTLHTPEVTYRLQKNTGQLNSESGQDNSYAGLRLRLEAGALGLPVVHEELTHRPSRNDEPTARFAGGEGTGTGTKAENPGTVGNVRSQISAATRQPSEHKRDNASDAPCVMQNVALADTPSSMSQPRQAEKPESTHTQKDIDKAEKDREKQEKDRAEAEAREVERQKAEKRRREEERRAQDLELERVRREKEQLVKEEEARKRRMELERKEKEAEETRRKEAEEKERAEAKRREAEIAKQTEQTSVVDQLENDPLMAKYISIVKERREKEKEKATAAPSVANQVEDLMKKLDTSSMLSSRSSISGLNFGAGDTADEVSAPGFDETTEDDGW